MCSYISLFSMALTDFGFTGLMLPLVVASLSIP